MRDGLERILRGRTGALVVLGDNDVSTRSATGGFALDVPFTPTALRELAKMDGAIVLDQRPARIVQAGVHLMPDPSIHTDETGTRHRTADRVARQSGLPVISVSSSMETISLFVGDSRYVLEHSGQILSRAEPGAATLERYRCRLDEVVQHAVLAGGPGRRDGPRRGPRRPAAGDGRAGLRRRSRATSSSSAPTAAC